MIDKEDVVHTYTMEYYPVIKKNENVATCSRWMDLERIMQSETGQTEKDMTYMSLKTTTNQ